MAHALPLLHTLWPCRFNTGPLDVGILVQDGARAVMGDCEAMWWNREKDRQRRLTAPHRIETGKEVIRWERTIGNLQGYDTPVRVRWRVGPPSGASDRAVAQAELITHICHERKNHRRKRSWGSPFTRSLSRLRLPKSWSSSAKTPPTTWAGPSVARLSSGLCCARSRKRGLRLPTHSSLKWSGN